MVKKVKQNLSKVKCFNCDNNRHLAKDGLELPWVQMITFPKVSWLSKGAHKSKASNLLKLTFKINNKIVSCFLDLRSTNSFITLKQRNIRIKIELMVDLIMVQLTQGIVKPPFNVASGVMLFWRGVQFF